MRPSAGSETLRVGGSSWAVLVALLGLAALVALALAGRPTFEDRRRECAMVAEVAVALGVRQIAGSLSEGGGGAGSSGAFDCRDAFTGAGMVVVEGAGDSPARVFFARPRFNGDDNAFIDMGLVCGPLCGEGERLTVVRRGGRWIVVAREPTWIA